MGRSRSYKEHLDESLQNPEEAVGYLNAALEDDDPRVFLLALRDVADAHGGLSWLSQESNLNRESLYRTLSSRGNPRLNSLKAVLDAMGLHLSVHSEHDCKPRPRRTKAPKRKKAA